jgi:uncharacterized membrane protein YjgN (DUF898 family)
VSDVVSSSTVGPGQGRPSTPGGEPVTFSWSGNPWSLVGLGFFNFFLTVITLGIYHFWGKTEVRRRLVGSIRVNDEPLEYTGTGMELFLGFLIVLLLVLLPIQALTIGANFYLGPAAAPGVVFLVLPLIWYLYGVAIYRARRYRRSRLLFRGVRGSVSGSSWVYGWQNLWTAMVSPFTWGWLTPWRDNYLHRTLIGATRFGDRPFKYTGKAGPLYPRFAFAWVAQMIALVMIFGLVTAVLWPKFAPAFAALQHAVRPDGQIDPNSPDAQALKQLIFPLVGAICAVFALYVLVATLIWSFFYALEYRYFSSQTNFEGLRFTLDVSGWSMFWLFFSNTLMSLATLTILSPVAEARVARYFVRRLSATGTVDFAQILQSQQRLGRTGEGLAEAFDVEASSYFILEI